MLSLRRRTAPTSGDLIHLSTPIPGGQLQHQATSSTCQHLYQEDSSNIRRPHPPVYTYTRRTAPTSGDLIHLSTPIPEGQLQHQATSSTCLHLYQKDSSNIRRPHSPVYTYTRRTAPTSGDLVHLLSSPIPGGQLRRQATSSTCLHLYLEDSSNIRRPHPPVNTYTRKTAPTLGDLIHLLSSPIPRGQLQHQATSSTCLHLHQEDSSNVRRSHPPVYTYTWRTAPTSGDLIHLSTPIPEGQLQHQTTSSTCLHLYQKNSSNIRRPHPSVVFTYTKRTAPTSGDLIFLSTPLPGGQLQRQATSSSCLHLYQEDSSNVRRPHPPVYTSTRRTAPTSGELIHPSTPIPGGQLQRPATSSSCLHLYQEDSSNVRRSHPPVYTYTRRTAPTSGDLILLSTPLPGGQLRRQATSSTCLHLYQEDSSNIRRPHPPVYTYTRRIAPTSGDLILLSTPLPGGQLQRQATSSTCQHLYQKDSSNVRRSHPPVVFTYTKRTAPTSGDLILLSTPLPGGQLQRQAISATCLDLYQEDSSKVRRPHPPVYTSTRRTA